MLDKFLRRQFAKIAALSAAGMARPLEVEARPASTPVRP